MKKLGYTLLGLVVVLIGGILIVPSFIDWNAQKGRIAFEVEKLTGRKLTIDGDVSLTILPAPALSAARVRLANIEGGSSPSMIELESLDVRIALVPLVQGRVEVESVVLVRPTILIEVLPDGRANWVFAKPDQAAPESTGESTGTPSGAPRGTSDGTGGFSEQVRLDSVRISDGTMIYRDAPAGREERIAGLNVEIVAGSLNGPFAVSGDAVARDIKIAFEVALGQIVREGATSLNLNLDLPDAGAKARFGGAISLHPDGASLRGRFKAEGGSLAALQALLSGGAAGPGVLAQPFGIEAEISADPQQITVAELTFRLGETAIEGEVRVKLDAPLDVRANLSASRLDLDKLLATGGTGAAGTAPVDVPVDVPAASGQPATAPAPDAAAAGLALPGDVNATLEVTVDAIIYRRQVVRQVLISMALAEGRLKVSQALALLPGGSDVSLTGVAAPVETPAGPDLRFTGRLESASDNLRGMLQWLGVDIASVPPGRLRRMSLSAKIDATTSQAALSDIDLRVDVSRATGGIVVALRERPGFGIGLALDKLNLDAYLPAPAAGQAAAAPQQETTGEEAATQAAGDDRGPAGPLAALAGFDANFDLSLGSLSLRGATARKLHLDATLQGGTVTLREAVVGDLAGSRARIVGTLADLATKPALALDVELSVPNPAKLAKLANLEAKTLARIGAFDLTASVKGTLERLGLDAKLTALGGRFGLAGAVQPLASPPGFDVKLAAKHPSLAKLIAALGVGPALDLKLGGLDLTASLRGSPVEIRVAELSGKLGPATLSGGFKADLSGPQVVVSGLDLGIGVKHPDLAGLVRALAPEVALGKGLGGVDVTARLAGGTDKIQISKLSGHVGPAALTGSLGADLSGPAPAVTDMDIGVAIEHPDLADLIRAVSPGAGVGRSLGGVDLKARITGSASVFQVADLTGHLGPAELTGRLGADLSGARPALDIELTTGELPLAALMAPMAAGGAAGGGTGGGTSGGGAKQGRWSTEPIDVSGLNAVDAEVKLNAKALLLENTRLDRVTLDASLKDGFLNLRKLNGTVYGGALAITGKVDARKTLEVGLAVTAIELDLARLLHDLAESDRVSGPLSLNASLSTRGGSEAALVSALSGQGRVEGTLKVKAKQEERVGSQLLGIAGALLGQKIKEFDQIRGLTDATNVLFNAFADAPAAVAGSFTVDRGVVVTNDLRVDGRRAVALTQARADLPRWLLDSSTGVYLAEDPNRPFVTIGLRGPLDAPNPRLSGTPLQPRQQLAPATGPAPSTSGQVQPAPQPAPLPAPQTTKPEDLLRKGLEQGLKSLFGN